MIALALVRRSLDSTNDLFDWEVVERPTVSTCAIPPRHGEKSRASVGVGRAVAIEEPPRRVKRLDR
jgi:hypothetical protein